MHLSAHTPANFEGLAFLDNPGGLGLLLALRGRHAAPARGGPVAATNVARAGRKASRLSEGSKGGVADGTHVEAAVF